MFAGGGCIVRILIGGRGATLCADAGPRAAIGHKDRCLLNEVILAVWRVRESSHQADAHRDDVKSIEVSVGLQDADWKVIGVEKRVPHDLVHTEVEVYHLTIGLIIDILAYEYGLSHMHRVLHLTFTINKHVALVV